MRLQKRVYFTIHNQFGFAMKKIQALALAVGMTIAVGLHAQNAKSLRTQAVMSYDAYNTDNSKTGELKKAKLNIDQAMADAQVNEDPKSWRYKATIYTAMAENERLRKEDRQIGLQAYDAWIRGLEIEEAKLSAKGKPLNKIPNKNEYTEGLERCANALYNCGVEALNEKGYGEAYPFFAAIVQLPQRSKNAFGDQAPSYRFKEIDAKRIAGIGAIYLGKMEEGDLLLRAVFNTAGISDETMANTYADAANAATEQQQLIKARQYVSEGRKKYPQHQRLLMSEINLAVLERRLPEVEPQIKQAIQANPNDAELIFVMGNLYDGLFREKIRPAERMAELSQNDERMGLDFLQKAVDYYTMALSANPKHYNSLYSLGVLHVNYANYGYKKQEKFPKDPHWQKLSDAAMEKALDYLLQAEKLDPSNKLALDALKSVYGIKGDTQKYEEYKAKAAKQ